MNIIVNGVKQGEQSIPGEMHNFTEKAHVTPSKVLINGVPEDELPQAPPPVVDPQTGAINLKAEQPFQVLETTEKPLPGFSIYDEDTFSIAENYGQWMNLKQNHSLDKMFLNSTPDALMHLMTLHKYIGEVLDLDKVQSQVNRADDDSDEEPDPMAEKPKGFKSTSPAKKAAPKKAAAKGYAKYKKPTDL